MFVVIDDRESVTQGYAAGFDREGEVSIGFSSKDFRDWLECAVGNDVMAIGAFLLGDCSDRTSTATITTSRSQTHHGRLDGHMVLDREVADQGGLSAINVLSSVSRLARRVWSPEEQTWSASCAP